MPDARPPSLRRMLGRALLRRCPRCGGQGAWFTGWFRRVERCRTCGYRYEREEGFMVGAIAINTILTSGAIILLLVVGIVASYPEIAVVPIIVACLVVAVALPVVSFPITYTTWAAIELAMRPLAPAEEADAATFVAAGLADRAPRSPAVGPTEPPPAGEDA